MITLVLHGEVRRFTGGRKTLEVASGPATVADLLSAHGIPAGGTAAYIVNDDQVEIGAPVKDGDRVEILPAISGGRS